MINFFLNSKPVSLENDFTIIQACQLFGIEIPHFCYHPRLDISGNCRMCLVEVEGFNKLVASCAMNISENMKIHTDTAKVKKARESVMEFLLINHPLDCPICDQGGECDLQDQAFKYGRGVNRYQEVKRSITNKDLGPFISTNMNRCIHCSRCVRFLDDVAGISELGMLHRGENSEITNYLGASLSSELSGNLIDICPVGALTSKPYKFIYRSWELQKTESIDVLDALCSNIRIDSKGLDVIRILPKINNAINEAWISDKARFSYDGLKIQRIDQPYIKEKGKFKKIGWDNALKIITQKMLNLKSKEIASLAGFFVPVETMFLMKKLLNFLDSDLYDANTLGYKFDNAARGNYIFNTGIENIEKANLCLIIGANIRKSAPVLNSRIRKSFKEKNLKIARIGKPEEQGYPVLELGDNLEILQLILEKKHIFAEMMHNVKNIMIIVGEAVFLRDDALAILSLIHQIVKRFHIINSQWNGFNILHNHASSVGALDLNFNFGINGAESILNLASESKIKMLYLLGADDFNVSKISKDVFVIYQGSHFDKAAAIADIVLPSAAYTEEDAIFINLEGRSQFAYRAVFPPKYALPNWQIIASLISRLDKSYKFCDIYGIRNDLFKDFTIFANIGQRTDSKFQYLEINQKPDFSHKLDKIDRSYYITDYITRASVNMSRALKAIEKL